MLARYKDIADAAWRIKTYIEDKQEKTDQSYMFKDVLNDVKESDFESLQKDLLKLGYDISINRTEHKTKRKIKIGEEKYSHFNVQKTMLFKDKERLKKELEKLKNEIEAIKAKSSSEVSEFIAALLSENNELRTKKSRAVNSGAKPFDDADIIRRIYEAYVDRNSLQDTADQLNREEIKTKRGNEWSKQGVSVVLKNQKYVEKGYVSQDTFDRVQQLCSQNRRRI